MVYKGDTWRMRNKELNLLSQMNEFKDWDVRDFIVHILELRQELNKEKIKQQELEIQLREKPIKKRQSEKVDLFADVKEHYKQEWSYPTKVAYLLTIKNSPLTSAQIHDILMEVDDNFSHGKDPRHKINTYLYLSRKYGRIKGVKLPGIKGYFFALPEWVSETGRLSKEYGGDLNRFKA
jgi:hypothetical protein